MKKTIDDKKEKEVSYKSDRLKYLRIKSALWYKNNKERAKAACYKWAKNHPEQVKAYKKSWLKKNKLKMTDYLKQWRKDNIEKTREYDRIRRARKKLKETETFKY
jgi:monomeric isocitrate dehydrogenase